MGGEVGAALAMGLEIAFPARGVAARQFAEGEDVAQVNAGPGEITFPVPSDRDPLYRLAPRRVLSGYYGCFEGIVTPFAKILKTLVRA